MDAIPQQNCRPAGIQGAPPPPPPRPRTAADTSATVGRTAFGDTVEISPRAIAVSASLREPEPEPSVDSAPEPEAAAPDGSAEAGGVGAAPAALEVVEDEPDEDELGTPEDELDMSVEEGAEGVADQAAEVENPVDEAPDDGMDEPAPGTAQNKGEKQLFAFLSGAGAEQRAEEPGQDETDRDADDAGTDDDGDPPQDGQSRRRAPSRR